LVHSTVTVVVTSRWVVLLATIGSYAPKFRSVAEMVQLAATLLLTLNVVDLVSATAECAVKSSAAAVAKVRIRVFTVVSWEGSECLQCHRTDSSTDCQTFDALFR